MQGMPLVSGIRQWWANPLSHAPCRLWSLLLMLLVALPGCMFAPPPPAPIELDLYQQWQLQPGDTIAGLTVSGGLGDISIVLNGQSIYAPFDGRTQLTTAGCVLFSSAEVPGYLFRLCGLSAPKLGGLRQGETIGTGKYLEFAALRKQADGRWAIVEPSKRILERALQQP